MKTALEQFCCNVQGATSIEYALIASLICMAVVAGATSVGDQLALIFQNIETEFKDAPKP